MRVLVLGAGRCGTTTFIRAAQAAIVNYSAGHETLTSLVGDARFAYPDGHIEADNRLSWLLGSVGRRFDHQETVYVHLRRDPEAIASSYRRKLSKAPIKERLRRARYDYAPPGIVRGFGHNVLMRGSIPEHEQLPISRFMVEVITDNVECFLADKPLKVELWIDKLDVDRLETFWEMAAVEGDFMAFEAGLREVHNAG